MRREPRETPAPQGPAPDSEAENSCVLSSSPVTGRLWPPRLGLGGEGLFCSRGEWRGHRVSSFLLPLVRTCQESLWQDFKCRRRPPLPDIWVTAPPRKGPPRTSQQEKGDVSKEAPSLWGRGRAPSHPPSPGSTVRLMRAASSELEKLVPRHVPSLPATFQGACRSPPVTPRGPPGMPSPVAMAVVPLAWPLEWDMPGQSRWLGRRTGCRGGASGQGRGDGHASQASARVRRAWRTSEQGLEGEIQAHR